MPLLALPWWAELLLQIAPAIPSGAAEIASIFRPHAGTDTGTKVLQTLGVVNSIAGGLAQFSSEHADAVAAAAAPQAPAPSSST